MSFFQITGGRGFAITFNNGWKVSVQFGPGHYGSNYGASYDEEPQCGERGAFEVETSIINPSCDLVALPGDTKTAQRYQRADQVLRTINLAAVQSPDAREIQAEEVATDTPNPRTVRVRIAVMLNERGEWAASGADDSHPGQAQREAYEAMRDPSSASCFWIEADLPIPEPPVVQAEVRPAGGES